jgi:hypothetical protein
MSTRFRKDSEDPSDMRSSTENLLCRFSLDAPPNLDSDLTDIEEPRAMKSNSDEVLDELSPIDLVMDRRENDDARLTKFNNDIPSLTPLKCDLTLKDEAMWK